MASIISLISPVKLTDFDIIAAVITVPYVNFGTYKTVSYVISTNDICIKLQYCYYILLFFGDRHRLSIRIGIFVFYTCLRVLRKKSKLRTIQLNVINFKRRCVVIIRDISSGLFDLSEMPIIGNWRLILCRFVHRTRTRAYSSP